MIYVFLCFSKAYAGWYECYNFKGHVANNPITMSLQIREGYFGENEKKKYNVIGVYKYDKYNSPIRLEGKLNFENRKIILHELTGDKYSASIEFIFSEQETSGFWQNNTTKNKVSLRLKFDSKLTDLERSSEFANIDILQSQSLREFYFIGNYSKVNGTDQALMNKLKIIRKKDNLMIQTIDLTNTREQTGNLMTIIFDNIEVIDPNKKVIGVSWNQGKFSEPLIIEYSRSDKKFKFQN